MKFAWSRLLLDTLFSCLIVWPTLTVSCNPAWVKYKEENGIKTVHVFFFTYNCLYLTGLVIILSLILNYLLYMGNTSKKEENTVVENSSGENSDENPGDAYEIDAILENRDVYAMESKITKIYKPFLALALSMNMILVLVFWPLYFIHPSLVKHPLTISGEYKTPLFKELTIHLFPFLISLYRYYEIRSVRTKYTRLLNYLYMIYIQVMFLVSKRFTGKYPYTMLEKMGVVNSVIFTFSMGLLSDVLGLILYKINMKIHKEEIEPEQPFITIK